MHEYDLPKTREDQIGTARKFPDMKPVAKTHRVNEPADFPLRGRIPAADPPHVLGAVLLRQSVHCSFLLLCQRLQEIGSFLGKLLDQPAEDFNLVQCCRAADLHQ